MAKYLVLGGSGFLGSKLVCKLAQNQKNEIIVADLRNRPEYEKLSNVTFQKIEFVHKTDFTKELNGVDVVYHLISTITPSDNMEHIWEDLEANLKPTIALLDAMAENPSCKLVFISSGGTVYGEKEQKAIAEEESRNPVCNYGISKDTIEKYILLYHRMYGIDYRIIRLGNPYGTKVRKNQKQGLIPIVIDRIMKEEPVTVFGDGKAVRDYIHVDDAIDAILAVEKTDCEEKVFNVGSGEGHSILQILDLIVQNLDCEYPELEFWPDRKCDVENNILDIHLIEEKTGWKTQVKLEDGIKMMIESIVSGDAKEESQGNMEAIVGDCLKMSDKAGKTEEPLLTVIVAVYKTEEFFERCLNSLFASEYKNLEILLIDDGSPDNCPALCDEYAKKDSRIRVIHKENGGGHSAKNLGIEIAKGEYIAICDNDDMVPKDAYRLLMDKAVATHADVIRGTVRRTYSDTNEARLFYRKEDDSFQTKLIGFQGAIYKTSMLQNNHIRLGAYRLGDDMCFMAQVMNYAQTFVYIDDITYEYIIRPANSKSASAIQNNNKNFPHYYDDFCWRRWVLSYVKEQKKLQDKYKDQLGVFCKIIDESWLSYPKEEREKCFELLKDIVGLIDWSIQKEKVKGYIQVDYDKFMTMDEAAYTKYLKFELGVKRRIKKLLRRK